MTVVIVRIAANVKTATIVIDATVRLGASSVRVVISVRSVIVVVAAAIAPTAICVIIATAVLRLER